MSVILFRFMFSLKFPLHISSLSNAHIFDAPNFFAAIDKGMLEVHIKAQSTPMTTITKSTLDNVIKKHNSDAGHYLKALREPINGKPFTREIKKLGNVKLYISQHEGGNQKIAIMRRPRMIIQTFKRLK